MVQKGYPGRTGVNGLIVRGAGTAGPPPGGYAGCGVGFLRRLGRGSTTGTPSSPASA